MGDPANNHLYVDKILDYHLVNKWYSERFWDLACNNAVPTEWIHLRRLYDIIQLGKTPNSCGNKFMTIWHMMPVVQQERNVEVDEMVRYQRFDDRADGFWLIVNEIFQWFVSPSNFDWEVSVFIRHDWVNGSYPTMAQWLVPARGGLFDWAVKVKIPKSSIAKRRWRE